MPRRPMNTTTASPVPSEMSASSDSWPPTGKTVMRLMTPAILHALARFGASAIGTVPGIASAHA